MDAVAVAPMQVKKSYSQESLDNGPCKSGPGLAQCAFCKESFQYVQVIDKSVGKKGTRIRCRECHAAENRLVNSASSAAEKKELKALRLTPALYAMKIVQLRSKHAFGITQRGCIKKYLQEIIIENKMVQQRGWIELDETGFIVYQMTKRELTREAAVALWERKKSDPETRWVKDACLDLVEMRSDCGI